MKTYIVDSFTNQIFKGNPAGVCIVEDRLTANTMLSIAQELNLSETAFIKKAMGSYNYNIRYFSPVMEIPLCGHATLASSKVIFDNSNLDSIAFMTIQNIPLHIYRRGALIEMKFPIYKTTKSKASVALLDALGLNEIINCEYNKETDILLLEISDSQILMELKPDFMALVNSHDAINGVLVTAAAQDGYDFHSRYFWPWSGTNEDPVTGGTHTFLAPYWKKRLGKDILKSFQSSSRTGYMEVEILDESRLLIKGEAVSVLEGELKI